MNNGWAYTAHFVDGRFTQIRWQRSGQPPKTSTRTLDQPNAQGQSIDLIAVHFWQRPA